VLCHHCPDRAIPRPDQSGWAQLQLLSQARKPLPVNANTVVPILRFPVDILNTEAIGKRAAQAFAARETVEPRLEWRISKPTVVTCEELI
jgi:hypothetical protein